MNIMEFIKDHFVIIIIISILLLIFMYSIFCVTLNKLNRAKYNKNTWMAWVPIFNIYLLGRLTIHTIFGIILALGFFLTIGFSLTNNGVSKYYSILPIDIQEPYAICYSAIIVILFIYAYIKTKNMIIPDEFKNNNYYSQNDYSNLNRPFIEKKDTNNKETNLSNEEVKKISLSSLNHHSEDKKE